MNHYDISKYKEMAPDIGKIIFSPAEIEEKVWDLGEAISRDYAGRNPLLVGVLKGVLVFMADLLRAITIPVEVDFMAISNYSPQARASGVVRLEKDFETPLEDRHVLFVEDVIDTGLTLNYLLRSLRERNPASLEICTLFNRPHHRLIDIPIKYKGFDLPDKFVVGYGLDHREKYRNLPFVALLKAHILP